MKSLNAINGSVAKSVAIHEKATNHLALWAVQKLKDHHLFYVLLLIAALTSTGWWYASHDGYAQALHAAELCRAQGKPIYLNGGGIACHPPKPKKRQKQLQQGDL
jgi:hypothetical protein